MYIRQIHTCLTKNINENPNRYTLISNRSAIVNEPTLYLKIFVEIYNCQQK